VKKEKEEQKALEAAKKRKALKEAGPKAKGKKVA
jgi:hypothetical protein